MPDQHSRSPLSTRFADLGAGKTASTAAAWPKGIQPPSRESCSCSSGVNWPGSRTSYLSRGKMAFLTARTIAIAACEGHLLATVRSECAGLAPTADERAATVGTGWTVGCLSLPVGSLTL